MRIGVLAVQGAFIEHEKKLEKLGLLKSTQHGNRVKYAVRVC